MLNYGTCRFCIHSPPSSTPSTWKCNVFLWYGWTVTWGIWAVTMEGRCDRPFVASPSPHSCDSGISVVYIFWDGNVHCLIVVRKCQVLPSPSSLSDDISLELEEFDLELYFPWREYCKSTSSSMFILHRITVFFLLQYPIDYISAFYWIVRNFEMNNFDLPPFFSPSPCRS